MIDLPSGYCLNADAENPTVMRNMSAQVFWNTEQINELKNRQGNLPEAEPSDVGKTLMVDSDGQWQLSDSLMVAIGHMGGIEEDLFALKASAAVCEASLNNLYADIVLVATQAHNILLGVLGD